MEILDNEQVTSSITPEMRSQLSNLIVVRSAIFCGVGFFAAILICVAFLGASFLTELWNELGIVVLGVLVGLIVTLLTTTRFFARVISEQKLISLLGGILIAVVTVIFGHFFGFLGFIIENMMKDFYDFPGFEGYIATLGLTAAFGGLPCIILGVIFGLNVGYKKREIYPRLAGRRRQ